MGKTRKDRNDLNDKDSHFRKKEGKPRKKDKGNVWKNRRTSKDFEDYDEEEFDEYT